jgi:hypothetical protein
MSLLIIKENHQLDEQLPTKQELVKQALKRLKEIEYQP